MSEGLAILDLPEEEPFTTVDFVYDTSTVDETPATGFLERYGTEPTVAEQNRIWETHLAWQEHAASTDLASTDLRHHKV